MIQVNFMSKLNYADEYAKILWIRKVQCISFEDCKTILNKSKVKKKYWNNLIFADISFHFSLSDKHVPVVSYHIWICTTSSEEGHCERTKERPISIVCCCSVGHCNVAIWNFSEYSTALTTIIHDIPLSWFKCMA